MAPSIGQQVIVESRANGNIAGQTVANAPADGYLLWLHGSTMWLAPFLNEKTPFDPVNDFASVTLTTRGPNVLVVHPSLPVKSVKELIALAKRNPAQLNYATGVTGSPNHIAGELLKARAGINMTRVAYRGTAIALVNLLVGEVQLAFAPASSALPHIESKRVRALAVGSLQSSVLFPGLPTVAASGLPGFELDAVYGISAPARVPSAIIKILNQEIARALQSTEAKRLLLGAGLEAVASTSEEFAAFIKADMAKSCNLIKETVPQI